MEYIVISQGAWPGGKYRLNEFIKKVNDAIRKGYRPIGGVCECETHLVQAMIKEDKAKSIIL